MTGTGAKPPAPGSAERPLRVKFEPRPVMELSRYRPSTGGPIPADDPARRPPRPTVSQNRCAAALVGMAATPHDNTNPSVDSLGVRGAATATGRGTDDADGGVARSTAVEGARSEFRRARHDHDGGWRPRGDVRASHRRRVRAVADAGAAKRCPDCRADAVTRWRRRGRLLRGRADPRARPGHGDLQQLPT
jgi:hypothetical protein